MIARNSLACCLLVACGGDARVGPDARALDASPDTLGTSTGDPPPSAIAMTVTALGVAAPDVPVYFQNADSSVVLATKTDSRGIAWAALGDGGFVTVIEPANGTGATPITTFAAVASADRLHLELPPPTLAPLVEVMLTVPDGGSQAASYQIHNSCGDLVGLAAPTGLVTFADCGAGHIDLVIVPIDAEGEPIPAVGARFAPDVLISNGQPSTIGGGYDQFITLPYLYRNIPTMVSWVGTYRAVLTPRGRAFDVSKGNDVTGVVSDSVVFPTVPGTTPVLTVTDEVPIATELGEQLFYDWRATNMTYDLDVGMNRLPAFSALPTYSPATHAITWGERSGTRDGNYVRAQLNAYRDDIPAGRAWHWRIAAPKSATTVTLPVLPFEGFDFNPSATDTVNIDLMTALVPNGYAAVRAHAFAELSTAITGPSGQMIVQTAHSPQL